jgi:small subunit ribosomal protein S1
MMSEDLQEMLTDSNLQIGDLIKGEVVAVDSEGVTVNLPHGFEGHIPTKELSALPTDDPSEVVHVGDTLIAVVKQIDRESGLVTLSKRQADSREAWDELQAKFDRGEVFEVTVRDVVKGGLVTDVGVRGFIPASLVDLRFVGDLQDFKGKQIHVKVVELDAAHNKLILSRKAVLEAEQQEKAVEVMQELSEGQILEGTVQRLTTFGAFVDVHGVDGLVHISELSWSHAEHPSDVVKEGEVVRVKVLKVDPDKGKISLSIKQAEPDPFERYSSLFHEGDVVEGTVKRVVDFGVFVELRPGLEGLVHISQIAHHRIGHPSEAVAPGDVVQVKILGVDPDRKRISLSIREADPKPISSAPPARRESHGRPSAAPTPSKPADTTQGTGATLGDLFGDLFKRD